MTGAAEAKLFREAEICYATMNLATDYDCWHAGEESVTVDMVLREPAPQHRQRQGHPQEGRGRAAPARRGGLRLPAGPGRGHHDRPQAHHAGRQKAAGLDHRQVRREGTPDEPGHRRLGRLRHHRNPDRQEGEDHRRLGHLLRRGGQLFHPAGHRGRGRAGLPAVRGGLPQEPGCRPGGAEDGQGRPDLPLARPLRRGPQPAGYHPDRPQLLLRLPARDPAMPTRRPTSCSWPTSIPTSRRPSSTRSKSRGSRPWTPSGCGSRPSPKPCAASCSAWTSISPTTRRPGC